jgi:hypothetical protein
VSPPSHRVKPRCRAWAKPRLVPNRPCPRVPPTAPPPSVRLRSASGQPAVSPACAAPSRQADRLPVGGTAACQSALRGQASRPPLPISVSGIRHPVSGIRHLASGICPPSHSAGTAPTAAPPRGPTTRPRLECGSLLPLSGFGWQAQWPVPPASGLHRSGQALCSRRPARFSTCGDRRVLRQKNRPSRAVFLMEAESRRAGRGIYSRGPRLPPPRR